MTKLTIDTKRQRSRGRRKRAGSAGFRRLRAGAHEIVELFDKSTGSIVRVAPGLGNLIYRFRVGRSDFLCGPPGGPAFLREGELAGIPIMWPWGGRLGAEQVRFGDRTVDLGANPHLRRCEQTGKPLHGFLTGPVPWAVVSCRAGADVAELVTGVNSSQVPGLPEAFPFPHRLEVAHRLRRTRLEIVARVTNHGHQPMPVCLGFHPYLRLPEAPRPEWRLRVPASLAWELDDHKVPTGARRPAGEVLPDVCGFPLGGRVLDDVFGGFLRDRMGQAQLSLQGGAWRLVVELDRGFPHAVVYAPASRERPFVCLEPMTSTPHAFALAEAGLGPELPRVEPGETWSASFRIRAERLRTSATEPLSALTSQNHRVGHLPLGRPDTRNGEAPPS
jgi:aldose 1-epimerase